MKRYDMIIVGAGPAGLSAAIEAAIPVQIVATSLEINCMVS